jgi:calcineurin-like phosphoesterase family protein
MNFYTADPHFFHQNIIEFCNRPFGSVTEMNGRILSNYQSVMTPEDDLWIIGDVAVVSIDAADKLTGMLSSIPGRKHLVTGNHDKPWIRGLDVWTSVHDLTEIADDGTRVTLCHYPMITFPGARRGALQLFGHVHQNWRGSRNSVNVGVDVWEFRTLALAEIKTRAARQPMNPVWNLVEPRTVI